MMGHTVFVVDFYNTQMYYILCSTSHYVHYVHVIENIGFIDRLYNDRIGTYKHTIYIYILTCVLIFVDCMYT